MIVRRNSGNRTLRDSNLLPAVKRVTSRETRRAFPGRGAAGIWTKNVRACMQEENDVLMRPTVPRLSITVYIALQPRRAVHRQLPQLVASCAGIG
jgi:hypothetical protein